MATIKINGVQATLSASEEAAITASRPTSAELLDFKRQNTTLARSEFCVAMMRDGWWTKAEAESAGSGQVPSLFSTVLAASVTAGVITQEESDVAEVTWSSLRQVERAHPVIPIAQTVYSMTDAQVDTLFGI